MAQNTVNQTPLDPNDPRDSAAGDAMDAVIRYQAIFRQKLLDAGIEAPLADTLVTTFVTSYWQAFFTAPGLGRIVIR